MKSSELDALETAARAKLPAKTHGTTMWDGPCGDSFCYHGCDSLHCHPSLALGKTPAEHNAKIDEMTKKDPVLIQIAEMRKKIRKKKEKKKS